MPITPKIPRRGRLVHRSREKRRSKAEYTIGPGLQKKTRKDYASRSGRLGMSVGQPGMDRNGGKLHEECGQKAPYEKLAGAGAMGEHPDRTN